MFSSAGRQLLSTHQESRLIHIIVIYTKASAFWYVSLLLFHKRLFMERFAKTAVVNLRVPALPKISHNSWQIFGIVDDILAFRSSLIQRSRMISSLLIKAIFFLICFYLWCLSSGPVHSYATIYLRVLESITVEDNALSSDQFILLLV